ncbi:MAG: LLM class flavin-dependent oxidoreductase [Microthrixaceae bacterium]
MLKIHWFLPTGGDSRDVSPSDDGSPVRPPTIDYLSQIARACDQLGFDAVLTPCGTGCEDSWITTAMLVPQTRRLRFLVAFRPGLLSPTLAAADGVDLPTPVGRPRDRQPRHGRRAPRARPLRRLRRQGRPVRPHR